MSLSYQEVKVIVADAIHSFSEGLEERLARGMTKALDIVTHDINERLRTIEEDQARILRHLGLKSEPKDEE